MPNLNFVPVIAGGADPFGGIAAQEMGWANFNAGQEDRNARRLQAAEEARNNYLGNLARMQQQDAAQQAAYAIADDRNAIEAQRYGADRAFRERQAAEGRRQFDINADLTKQQWQAQTDKETRAKTEQQDYLNNLGETMAPHVAEVGADYEASQKRVSDADVALRTRATEWQSKLGGGVWNAKNGRFENLVLGRPVDWSTPEKKALAEQAAEDMGRVTAEYDNATREARDAKQEWFSLHRDLTQQGLPPININGKWHPHSPLLKKTFGEMVKAAEKETQPKPIEPIKLARIGMDVLNTAADSRGPDWMQAGVNAGGVEPGSLPPGLEIKRVPDGTPGADLVFNPANGKVVHRTTVTAPPAPVVAPVPRAFIPAPTSGTGNTGVSAPVAARLPMTTVVPPQGPPMNPTWTPNGFADASGRVESAANFDTSNNRPLAYRSPDDVINLYYDGRLSKTQALTALQSNFPGLPPNRALQISMGPEWQKPRVKKTLRWDPASGEQFSNSGIVWGRPPSPYE